MGRVGHASNSARLTEIAAVDRERPGVIPVFSSHAGPPMPTRGSEPCRPRPPGVCASLACTPLRPQQPSRRPPPAGRRGPRRARRRLREATASTMALLACRKSGATMAANGAPGPLAGWPRPPEGLRCARCPCRRRNSAATPTTSTDGGGVPLAAPGSTNSKTHRPALLGPPLPARRVRTHVGRGQRARRSCWWCAQPCFSRVCARDDARRALSC